MCAQLEEGRAEHPGRVLCRLQRSLVWVKYPGVQLLHHMASGCFLKELSSCLPEGPHHFTSHPQGLGAGFSGLRASFISIQALPVHVPGAGERGFLGPRGSCWKRRSAGLASYVRRLPRAPLSPAPAVDGCCLPTRTLYAEALTAPLRQYVEGPLEVLGFG